MQSFAQACSFSIATLQWFTPVPGLGPELCHDRSLACLGFPRPWYRRCVTVALGVPSVMVSGLASGSGTRAPLWPILPSTDTRVVSVVLRVNVLRSTHNCLRVPFRLMNILIQFGQNLKFGRRVFGPQKQKSKSERSGTSNAVSDCRASQLRK